MCGNQSLIPSKDLFGNSFALDQDMVGALIIVAHTAVVQMAFLRSRLVKQV